MKKIALLAAAAVISAATFATDAFAAPTLDARIRVGTGTFTNFPGVTSGALTFSTNISGGGGQFSVSGTATGIPTGLQAPSFASSTTTISSNGTFTGSPVIELQFTQFDVPSASAGGMFAQLANTFGANFLNNPGNAITSITIMNYASANNQPFSLGTLLASVTYTPSGGQVQATGPVNGNVTLTGPLFSETTVIRATFTGSGAALQANAQIVAVPEPASLALLGTALLGLGVARQLRRRG